MTPHFNITVTGYSGDQNTVIRSRLFHLIVKKNVKDTADSFEISLSDVRQQLAMPEMDDEVTIELGYKESAELVNMGSYTIDEVDLKGPPDTLMFSGNTNNTDMGNQVSRSWESVTLRTVFESVAKGRKNKQGEPLTVEIDGNFGERFFKHLDQVNESDTTFLYRLCRRVGGYYNCHGHTIGIYATDQGFVPAYEAVAEPVTLSLKELSTWTLSMPNQTNYDHVRVWVRNDDRRSGEDYYLEVYHPPYEPPEDDKDVGEGDVRVFTVQRSVDTKERAQREAEKIYTDLKHKSQQLTLTMPGKPELQAGVHVYFADGRPELKGSEENPKYWIVNEVIHRLDTTGYSTECKLWQPAEGSINPDEQRQEPV